ncbi:MAG TPA: hypothetical protein VG602_08395, partial [Actinomycetota bacterium]|nr:hypothetical protein [Actinomycetota bacterium]
MFRRTMLAALLTLVVGVPAFAQEASCRQIRGMSTPDVTTDDVFVCRQDVWVHKAGTRLGNLAGVGQDTIPSWDTTKPTGSLASGGAAWLTIAAYDLFAQDPIGRAMFSGPFTGTLDTLAFRAYVRSPIYENGGSWPMTIKLSIDGEVIFDNFDPGAVRAPLKTDGNLRRVDVAFVNVYDAMKSAGLDLTATKEHRIQLELCS